MLANLQSSQRSVARAPVRADPAGGGTDAPPFSTEHGGVVVNFGVSRHAFATVDLLPTGSGVAIYSHDLNRGVSASDSSLLDGSGLEFLEAFVRRLVPSGDGILLTTQSDVPPGAGLGGSGALGVAVVAALGQAYGVARSAHETAQLANEVERIDLSYPGGNQDSFGAAFGGLNHLVYSADGSTERRAIDAPSDTLRDLEQNSLLIYTEEAHVSGNIHRDIKESYGLPNSPTVAAMKGLRAAAIDMTKALENGNLAEYGELLSESCRQLYRLHPSCECESHRRLFRELEPWIAGGKTCGAGGGGFLLVLARPGCRAECAHRARELGGMVWPVVLDLQGVTSWSTAPLESQGLAEYDARMQQG